MLFFSAFIIEDKDEGILIFSRCSFLNCIREFYRMSCFKKDPFPARDVFQEIF